MQTIHQIIIEATSGGFWTFCGYLILINSILLIPARLILFVIGKILRRSTFIKKQPTAEDVKRWFQILVGKGETEMQKDIEKTYKQRR